MLCPRQRIAPRPAMTSDDGSGTAWKATLSTPSWRVPALSTSANRRRSVCPVFAKKGVLEVDAERRVARDERVAHVEVEGHALHGRSLNIGRTVQANRNCHWTVNSSFPAELGSGVSSNNRRQIFQVRPCHVSGSKPGGSACPSAFLSETRLQCMSFEVEEDVTCKMIGGH
jgi:hypothetical protein